jgi:hypothetical protein
MHGLAAMPPIVGQTDRIPKGRDKNRIDYSSKKRKKRKNKTSIPESISSKR